MNFKMNFIGYNLRMVWLVDNVTIEVFFIGCFPTQGVFLGPKLRVPVRKGPAGIKVNLNTWNLEKNTGGFFSP